MAKNRQSSNKKGRANVKFTSNSCQKEDTEYEPVEGKLVYRPPGYGQSKIDKADKMPVRHCILCHLKPCIKVAMDSQIRDMCHKHIVDDGRTDAFTSKAVVKYLHKEHCRLFMKRYRIKDPIPECIQKTGNWEVEIYAKELRQGMSKKEKKASKKDGWNENEPDVFSLSRSDEEEEESSLDGESADSPSTCVGGEEHAVGFLYMGQRILPGIL